MLFYYFDLHDYCLNKIKMNTLKTFCIFFTIAVLISFTSCEENDVKEVELSLSTHELLEDFRAGTYEVELTANGEWKVMNFHSWCIATPESGTGNATLTITLSENNTKSDRNSVIDVKSGNKTESISVTQYATTPTLEVDKASVNVGFEGNIIELVVSTNLPSWYMIIPNWCESITPMSYRKKETLITETVIKIKVKENIKKQGRQGNIRLIGNNGKLITNITIVQDAIEHILFSASSETKSTSTKFTDSWTASSDESWCIVPATGSGDNIVINVSSNTEILPRKTFVTIKSGDNERKLVVAQEPKVNVDPSQTWTDVNGVRFNSIPGDKKFWNTGEVLEYNRATVGSGVNIVIFNDAFNAMEMAVGGAYEISAKETAELFLSMPVVRDYRDHFNVYILMRVWEKSGLYNLYPDGKFRTLADGQEYRFLPYIENMPQLQGAAFNQISSVHLSNGMAGGYMWTGGTGIQYAECSFGCEGDYPYWMIHEMLGHAFASLGDVYLLSSDISEWDFFLKDRLPNGVVSTDSWGLREWGLNCRVIEWDQDAWDEFISLPGNAQYASNLNSYKMDLPPNYRTKHPTYTGGDEIWAMNYSLNFMNYYHLWNSPWDRYLIYRAVKGLAGLEYSLNDFFANDQKYANVTDWYAFLGVKNWKYTYSYGPNTYASPDSPFAPWDNEETK